MKRVLKELFVFLTAGTFAAVLALFVTWTFLTHFPFEWLSADAGHPHRAPHQFQMLTSSTLAQAEAKQEPDEPGRVNFSK